MLHAYFFFYYLKDVCIYDMHVPYYPYSPCSYTLSYYHPYSILQFYTWYYCVYFLVLRVIALLV